MAKTRSHYDNLMVAKNASPRVIKAAYKALSQTYHPDKYAGGREEAERIMKIINVAYEVLSDPRKKSEHDAWLAREVDIPDASAAHPDEPRPKPEAQPSRRWFLPLAIAIAIVFGFAIGSAKRVLREPQSGITYLSSPGSGPVIEAKSEPPVKPAEAEDGEQASSEDSHMANTRGIAAETDTPKADASAGNETPKTGSRAPAILRTDPGLRNAEDSFLAGGGRYASAMRHLSKGEYGDALALLHRAAENEDAAAQNTLGALYSKGEGVFKDRNRAMYWYGKAAEQGDAEAQYRYGLNYVGDPGLRRDYYKGIYWLGQAARQGHIEAGRLLKQQPLPESMPPECVIKPVMNDDDLQLCKISVRKE